MLGNVQKPLTKCFQAAAQEGTDGAKVLFSVAVDVEPRAVWEEEKLADMLYKTVIEGNQNRSF